MFGRPKRPALFANVTTFSGDKKGFRPAPQPRPQRPRVDSWTKGEQGEQALVDYIRQWLPHWAPGITDVPMLRNVQFLDGEADIDIVVFWTTGIWVIDAKSWGASTVRRVSADPLEIARMAAFAKAQAGWVSVLLEDELVRNSSLFVSPTLVMVDQPWVSDNLDNEIPVDTMQESIVRMRDSEQVCSIEEARHLHRLLLERAGLLAPPANRRGSLPSRA